MTETGRGSTAGSGPDSTGVTESSPDSPTDSAHPDTDSHPARLTRRPTSLSSAIAGGGALVALAGAGYGSLAGLFVGLVGAGILAFGLIRGHNGAIDTASLLLFVGVVIGGIQGGSVEWTLVGTAGCIVTWDLGQCATDLGDQLGREANTARLEAVHALSSVFVALLTVTVAYTLFVFSAGGQPVAAVVFLLLAAGLVTIGLGSRYDRSSSRSRSGPGPR